MRILTVHNRYLFRGGEDESRESEDKLLSAHGHQIREIAFNNDSIDRNGLFQVGCNASWSQGSYDRIAAELAAWKPHILDVHNFFPLASPAVHHAARHMRVPVVQTLHNYRLLCPGATLLRDGVPCEDCTRHLVPWPGVMHRCYRGSALQTGAVSLMISIHRLLRTWQRCVGVFVAVSQFEKRKFVENGFSESKIAVKPNFVEDPGEPGKGGDQFLFVGRLSREKGILPLLAAMDRTGPDVRLKIIGDGPLQPEVLAATERNPRVRFLGRLPQSEVLSHMSSAMCVLIPSIWYETFGRTAVEAYSVGTPVIASRIGALAEIVDIGRTGFLCEPDDPAGLARAMTWFTQNQPAMPEMRLQARLEYLAKYTPERNYNLLMPIYERAIAEARTARGLH